MATEVSSLMRQLARHDKEGGGMESPRGGDLVTRDLLGGRWAAAPVGAWKGQDLGVKDLNMPLSCSRSPPRLAAPKPHALLQDQAAASLDLGLRSSAPPPPAEYQSVCTLEKVRSALERAQRDSSLRKPPAAPSVPASPSSSSTTMSTAKRPPAAGRDEGGESATKPPSSSFSSSSSSPSSSAVVQGVGEGGGARMEAAGCPSCLLYVLISRSDPRCPRCSSAVPLRPLPCKRPRIDLNAAAVAAAEPAAAVDPKATLRFL